MKRLLFVTVFILTGLSAFSQDAVIEQLTGVVEVKQPKESSFRAAVQGDKIYKETVISTSFKSYAIVRIGGTVITVRPLTVLSLAEVQISAEAETLNVNLQTGRVRVEVKPPAGAKALTTVSSPSSTASVRGTSFEFDTNNLYVAEGTVSFVGSRGQDILVSAGGSSRVEQTGRVTAPRDERNANLMPPSPVGTGAEGAPASGPVTTSAPFTIELEFHD